MTIENKRNYASTVYINTPETSWALFMYSPNGDLFLSSDWGSYTNRWRGFNTDFETFLKGLSVEYFVSKLSISDANQLKTSEKQQEILTLLVGHFITTLNNQKSENFELPEMNRPVLAQCKRSNGLIECHQIKRISIKDNNKGWQWSSVDFNSYFTLEVISWEYLNNK